MPKTMARGVVTAITLEVLFLWCSPGAAHDDHSHCESATTDFTTNTWIGNGFCDLDLNNEACGYDGGDCCECTCVDTSLFVCGNNGFSCTDPDAPCYDPNVATPLANCTGSISSVGNGFCEIELNNQDCEYDGGDCCECSCTDGPEYTCGLLGYSCVDPQCRDLANAIIFPDCEGDLINLGDGSCDLDTNTETCGYDGGDCCICSCLDNSDVCSSFFLCVDPDAADELYQCEAAPAAVRPCSVETQQNWVVANTAQARTMAEAVNCSNGKFSVEWRGHVKIEETIYVVGGTVLNITGSGSNSSMDGARERRIFTVVGASLYLSDVTISSGSAPVGGAIAVSASNVTLTRTSFTGNRAAALGGALFVIYGSRVSFDGDISVFENNEVSADGGAIYASHGSEVSWSERTTARFVNNSAGRHGGALYVAGFSVASWTGGNTSLLNNVAHHSGGAIMAAYWSHTSWSGDAIISNNTAGAYGGAVWAFYASSVAWRGDATFSYNDVDFFGGAVSVAYNSSASWTARLVFVHNTAGTVGGALHVSSSSSVFWIGRSSFDRNEGGYSCGGVYVGDNSTAFWSSNTTFTNNTAREWTGGALCADDFSRIFWTGETIFHANEATHGPALALDRNSAVSCEGKTTFSCNRGDLDIGVGGAVYIHDNSDIYFMLETTFFNNVAFAAGAMYVASNSTSSFNGTTIFHGNAAIGGSAGALGVQASSVYWGGESTIFSGNTADGSGGAVASVTFDVDPGGRASSIVVTGPTSFVNNTSKANGGALSVVDSSSVAFETMRVMFANNSAEGDGGAFYMWGTNIGPQFRGVKFLNNIAQHGGGVYSTGSGNAKISLGGAEVTNPTTFDGCVFVGNTAIATGGAIQTAAGEDHMLNSIFTENTAGVGGALRLAGTARIENCSFVDNRSNPEDGPAVSNIGYISGMWNCSFYGNSFSCAQESFLHFDSRGNTYEVACNGCDLSCEGCSFDQPPRVPLCIDTLDHSTSSGGRTTLDMINIDSGYWRATNSSNEVLVCYNSDACLGGLTGSASYCRKGYEGPYCSVCSDGYTSSLGFTCNKCSGSTGGIVLAIVVAVVIVIILAAVSVFLVSGEVVIGSWRAFFGRLVRYIPLQVIKIIIVAWQILTQFAAVTNVHYPYVYQRFLDSIMILNFDLSWIPAVGCVLSLDFHDRLLLATLSPLVVLLLLGATFAFAVRANNSSERELRSIRHKHLSAVLLVTFFVYSSVSSIVFQTFACEGLDDGKIYLRADYRIECDSSKHAALQIYAGFMILLYPVGIPALYAGLLFKDRNVLAMKDELRKDHFEVRSTSNLWKPYKPSAFYYEVIECARRVLLAGVVVFILPNTAGQIAVTLVIAFFFTVVTESLSPYSSRVDAWVARVGHVVVFISVYLALLLKVDVSAERYQSQKVFEVILVFTHACMIGAAIIETILAMCSVRVIARDNPSPKVSRISRTVTGISHRINICSEQSDDVDSTVPVAESKTEHLPVWERQQDLSCRTNMI